MSQGNAAGGKYSIPQSSQGEEDKFFSPKIALSPLNEVNSRALQKQAQVLPKAMGSQQFSSGSQQFSSGPLSTKAAGPLPTHRRAPASRANPNPNLRFRQVKASIDELKRYQEENVSEAVEELGRALAGWKIRFFIELARRKVREVKIKQDAHAQFLILGREVDKLSQALETERNMSKEKYFHQDVVELKESVMHWKQKAAEQAELLEAALRQKGVLEGVHAAELQLSEQLRGELAVSQRTCQELIVTSNSLETNRALYEKEGDVIKQICAEYDRKLEEARMVAVGLKQTIVDMELHERSTQRDLQLRHEGEIELRSGLVAGLKDSVAQLSQEKNKLHSDLGQAVEAGEQLRQQLEQMRAANAKLQNDHGVFEQLITDFSVKAKDSEKNRLAQHIRISELTIRNENQSAKIDSLQGSVKALSEELGRLKDRYLIAAQELDRSMMVKEDCEEWVRIRTLTILNTSGYCRFIEEQLFNARREVLRHEEISRNILEDIPPPGAERLLPVGFEDMFETGDPAVKVHTPVPHRRVEELEGRLAGMIEGLEVRLAQAVLEATPAKESLLTALERQVQQAVRESIAAITAAQAKPQACVPPEEALVTPASLSTMVAGLEARLNGLVATAAEKVNSLSSTTHQLAISPQGHSRSGYLSPEPSQAYLSPPAADAGDEYLRRSEKRTALKTMTQIRHAIEEEQEHAEELAEELDFLVSRKAEVRAALLRWQDDFTSLCGRGADASDKAKSNKYSELISGYREVHREIEQKHSALLAIADSVEAQKIQLHSSTLVVEGITGVKQPLHSYGVRIKESHRLSATAVDPLLLGEDGARGAQLGTPGMARAVGQVAPRRQQQTPPPRGPTTPQASKSASSPRKAPEGRGRDKEREKGPAPAPAVAPRREDAPPADAPADAPVKSPPAAAAKALLTGIKQTQEALQLAGERKASTAAALKEWGVQFRTRSGRDPGKGDLDAGVVETYNEAKRGEARLVQELAALNAAYEQAAKEALFS